MKEAGADAEKHLTAGDSLQPAPVDQKSGSVESKLITEGVIILIGTALAYLASFLYEFGYSIHFGIPIEFINVTIQNILIYTVSLTIIFCLLVQWIDSILLMAQSGLDLERNFVLMFVKKYGMWLLVAAIVILASGYDILAVVYFVINPGILIIFDFILPLWRIGDATYLNGLRDILSRPLTPRYDTERGLFSNKTFKMAYAWCAFICLLLTLCVITGRGTARTRSTFPVISSKDGIEVILRRYGDYFVLAKYDPEKRSLVGEFRLVAATEFKDPFTVKHLGGIGQYTPSNLETTETTRGGLPSNAVENPAKIQVKPIKTEKEPAKTQEKPAVPKTEVTPAKTQASPPPTMPEPKPQTKYQATKPEAKDEVKQQIGQKSELKPFVGTHPPQPETKHRPIPKDTPKTQGVPKSTDGLPVP